MKKAEDQTAFYKLIELITSEATVNVTVDPSNINLGLVVNVSIVDGQTHQVLFPTRKLLARNHLSVVEVCLAILRGPRKALCVGMKVYPPSRSFSAVLVPQHEGQ